MNYGIDGVKLPLKDDKFDDRELTLLSEEEIYEEGGSQLDVLHKYGPIAAMTDLVVLTGGYFEVGKTLHAAPDDISLKGKAGWFYTKSPYDSDGSLLTVDFDGSRSKGDLTYLTLTRGGAIRPVLISSSVFSQISPKRMKRGYKGVDEVEYGEYPQYAPDSGMQRRLEREYSLGMLVATGRDYTFDRTKYNDYTQPFAPITYDEYEYQGKRYIRVQARSSNGGRKFKLSNGVKYRDGDNVWVEVSPVVWLIDDRTKKLVSKRCILSGIRFSGVGLYHGDFSKTDVKKYLDKYMLNDLTQTETYTRIKDVTPKKDIKKTVNPYGFSFNEVDEEEIIKGAVESNVPVFLHGRSSEGKSARIKELDSDCEIIYMRNATPDSLNGKSVYNQETGEMIDIKPSWLVKLEEKCEKEPDKIHIVFFDELTNALPSIQGMAFNIVLDREVNGKWSLPKNARIAAAGNDMNDSLAANQMAEPLFNRFAHVYIETTPETWLKWAITPKEDYKRLDYKEEKPPLKIHPAIYTYIAFTNGNALRSEYTGEKPNADPRKWEMASKVLYKTGNPQMLRALVGEDITKEFIEFCNQPVISLEDVLNDNYTNGDVMLLNTSERYSTMLGLIRAQEEDIMKVRKFVMKLGPEFGSIFDAIWTHGDERRLELIAEEKLMEQGMGGINNGR